MATSPHAWRFGCPIFLTLLTVPSSAVLPGVDDDRHAALPGGVRAVWSLEKADRELTPTRERVSINGLWRWQPAMPGVVEPPQDAWGYFKVPGPWPGITDYLQHDSQTLFPHPRWKDAPLAEVNAAWYQREITIPGDWAGRRVILGLEYLNSLATVFVDGHRAGELRYPGGELDLTPLKLTPGNHELSLLVAALPLKGVMMSYTDSASARQVKGEVARRGLCGDASLAVMPGSERIEGVRVETSVRKSQLTFDAALGNLARDHIYNLLAVVSREGRVLGEFKSPELTRADLSTGRYRFTVDWKPERLWDLHTPGHLEALRLILLDDRGRHLDVFWDERFGFREFWIEGRDFFLNGKRIFLSAVPFDNAQVSVALAGYAAARESLERLKSFGINFVYTHNYGCEPGSHLSFAEILRAADDVGVLVAFSQPHFSQYEWEGPGAGRENAYLRHAAYYVQAAGNHPSVVFYVMSHNATGYDEDMNPDLFGIGRAPRDRWALNNVRLASRAETLVQQLDPSRIVYHHASGNLGVLHNSNFYPNFVPMQELSDWFEPWSRAGTKPAFTCEYGAPFTWDWTMYRGWYRGQRSFGSARVPWEFCLAEWNAQFLGDRAYRLTEMEKKNLRWEARQFREGKLWHRWDYPYEVGSKVFDDRHEVIGRYLTDNFRAFRTLGVSAISPWEHDHFWRLREGVDRSRKDLAVDWEKLQRPGYSADYVGPTYERMDLAFGRDDWTPTADGRALLRNNRDRLAYIAGKDGQVTGKDHNALPGEVLSRQFVILNNSRIPTTCEVSWSIGLPTPIEGTARATVPTGEQRRIPVTLPLPSSLEPGRYALHARFRFGDEVQDDQFTFDVLARPGPSLHSSARIAVYDPKGETSSLLKALRVTFDPVGADADLAPFNLLIVGKGALSVDGPAPRIDRVRDGLHVIVFEQTSQSLERRLGFRVVEYGLREVYPRVPDHPLLAGLTADHLHDWRGESTLLPPRLDYERRPMHGPTIRWCDLPVSRVWRCGNRGNVASVLIEKPARGDFLPIVDGGFGLQYSPLLEYRDGRGRVLFCQLDVTGRTEDDPAAAAIVRNLLGYLSSPRSLPSRRKVVYAGSPDGLAHLRSAGYDPIQYADAKLGSDHVLVLAPGEKTIRTATDPTIADWLDAGGRLLAVGCDQGYFHSVLPSIRTRRDEHIAAFFEPPPLGSPLAGVGPADIHNRDPRDYSLVTGGADLLGDGVLAFAADRRVVLCQVIPWGFANDGTANVKRTFRRAAFVLTRLLGNLDAAGSTPLLERFRTPVIPGNSQQRWESGLYLDHPVEWDDPYRFFRW